jgi:hypothetical protein
MELELQNMKEEKKNMVRKLRLIEVQEKKMLLIATVSVLLVAFVFALFAVANSKWNVVCAVCGLHCPLPCVSMISRVVI